VLYLGKPSLMLMYNIVVCVNVIEQCSRYMGSMHASHGGRGAVAWGGQHAKHTAWQSNEM